MEIDDSTLAERVRDALRRSGRSQADVARSINIDETALSKMLTGKRRISSLELAKIADEVGASVAALLADTYDAQALSIAGRVDVARAPAGDATAFVDSLLDLDELLAELGFPAETPVPDLPLSIPAGDEVHQAGILAERVFGYLGETHSGPFTAGVGRLAQAAELRLGVDVALFPSNGGLDGLSVRRGPFRLVVVNSATAATRQLFTLAHEIGHLVAGDTDHGFTLDAAGGYIVVDENVYGRTTLEERRANSFASALLMPAQVLRQHVAERTVDGEVVGRLLGRFGVSFDALVYRLHNIGVINAPARDELRSLPARRSSLRFGGSGATRTRRVPRNLLRRALDAYDAGLVGPQLLADLTGSDLTEMLRQLEPDAPAYDEVGNGTDTLGVL